MFLPRAYSHHSLLSALPQIPKLIATAKEKGYTTLALTDEDSGSGLIEFYDECLRQEIKPVLGATLRIPNYPDHFNQSFSGDTNFSKIAILAKNLNGYKNLLKLISISRTVREEPKYHLTFDDLKKSLDDNGDFYILIAGNDHELIQGLRGNKLSLSEKILENYLTAFGAKNLLVELAMPLMGENLEKVTQINMQLMSLLEKKQVNYLISPASRYLEAEDEEAFRVVLAIRDQVRLSDINLTRFFNLPSKEELLKSFDYAPKALDTSLLEREFDIVLQTDFDKHADKAFFPKFELAEGQNSIDRLAWEVYSGLLVRFSGEGRSRQFWQEKFPYSKLAELKNFCEQIVPDADKLYGYPEDYWRQNSIQTYISRIEYELGIIKQKGYSEYFLVFGDIMSFCRENEIITNTRGSAAASLVGYLININVLDPLMYNLPFERFLNPDRPSPPDIDGDFADDKRDLVVNYIRQKYGNTKVSQIITFGTMLPRAAVRDVGRVLGISYKKCDRLSKLIPIAPQGRKTTFDFAFETSSEVREVYEKDEESRIIIDIARKIEGNYRHASSHAAGILIAPTNLTDFTPIQWDSEHKMVVSQYDMKICEKVGLVKLDILGITNLAVLGNAISLAKKRRDLEIDLLNIDTQDTEAFDLLAKGRTAGIFQLSGASMTRYLVELEPTRVEDLMAMVALYRPGPMANIPEFIKRKNNPKKISYYVPQMKQWMEKTYGILVYQEDLLLTAINLAGYSWGEVDILRKGMGKKIKAVIDGQYPKFIQGCMEYGGLTKDKAEQIWEAFLPFAAYGFNKSHSASYGMVAYWTAYMKSKYTVEYMTALMTAESNNLDKVAEAIRECREMGIQVLPPDVNKSSHNFSVEDNQTIRYGLASVKNLGADVIKQIITTREEDGFFESIEDFLSRASLFSGFNKRNLEALILSGSLDNLGQKALEKIRR